MSERQRAENVWDPGGPSMLDLDCSNTLGNGWDPGPSREAQNNLQK